MRIRSLLGVLVLLAGAVFFFRLQEQNSALFDARIELGSGRSVSVAAGLVVAFLVGFVPLALILITRALQAELEARRARKRRREEASLEGQQDRARDLLADEQTAAALLELEGYLARRPEDVDALVALGSALRAGGRADEAVEVHRRALRLAPHRVRVLLELAGDFRALDQLEAARDVENRILREHAGFGWSVLRRRRQQALAAERWAEVLALQEELQLRWPEQHDAIRQREVPLGIGLRYRRALERYESDDLASAGAMLEELLTEVPEFLPARLLLGEIRALEDRAEEAVRLWTEAYRETGSPILLQRLEDFWIESQAPERALQTLRGLIGQSQSDVLPRFFLGRLYYRLEMLDEALRELAPLRDRIARSPTYRFLLARLHERRGETNQALAEYRACLREVGLGLAEYRCRVCGSRYREWRDYCPRCQSWNSVEMDFEEEKLSARELGIMDLSVWGPLEGLPDEAGRPNSDLAS